MSLVVAIVGSRDGLPWREIKLELGLLLGREDIGTVVSGGALGVDRLAESMALAAGKRTRVIRPEWDKYGKSAGFRRNVQIVEAAHEVFAFWNGTSKGTKHTIDIARKMGVTVHVWRGGSWLTIDGDKPKPRKPTVAEGSKT